MSDYGRGESPQNLDDLLGGPLMAKLNRMPEVRWDRIESVRASVQDPSYLDKHLDQAINHLISDLS